MNVGSLVKIKKHLKAGRDHGDIHVFDDQKEWFGKRGFVIAYDEKENAVKVHGWWWSVDAVKPVRFMLGGM